jgi:hypothetical protein
LPTGPATVEAKAFPTVDASGVAQAQGTVAFTIVGGQDTSVHLTLNSTIDHLEISPLLNQLAVGQSAHLMVTAKDASGNVVLTSSSKIVFQSLTPGTLTVDPDGTLTAISGGQGTVQVTETESGKTAVLTFAEPIVHWDVSKDFSVASNPNGAWAYGYWLTFGEPLRLFLHSRSSSDISSWYSGLDPEGYHAANRTSNTYTLNDGQAIPTIVPPATFWMHPGPNGEYAVTQWTAPADGAFAVHAVFTGRSNTTTGVYVRANDVTIFSGAIVGYLATQTTDQKVSLAKGQTIQFVLSDGGNGWDYDSTSLDAVIDTQ